MITAPVPVVRRALTRYRVMAWIVGVMLLTLVTAMILKYGFGIGSTTYVAIAHGWLYMVYVIVALDLCLRMRWPFTRIIFVVLAGTIPFVSFIAEHKVTGWVRAEIEAAEAAGAAPVVPEVPSA